MNPMHGGDGGPHGMPGPTWWGHDPPKGIATNATERDVANTFVTHALEQRTRRAICALLWISPESRRTWDRLAGSRLSLHAWLATPCVSREPTAIQGESPPSVPPT